MNESLPACLPLSPPRTGAHPEHLCLSLVSKANLQEALKTQVEPVSDAEAGFLGHPRPSQVPLGARPCLSSESYNPGQAERLEAHTWVFGALMFKAM